MFIRLFLLASLALVIKCDSVKRTVEMTQMLGVDTVHDNVMKIDKDTIITRNLKLGKRSDLRKSTPKAEDREPDWSYHAVPPEVSKYVDEFKNNMTECLKEVQANDKRTVKRLSPKTESPVHGECLIACVLKRNGVIQKSKVNKENLILLVNRFFGKDTKLMKKLEKNLDQCVEMSANHRDDCDLAAKLNECTNALMQSNKRKVVVNY